MTAYRTLSTLTAKGLPIREPLERLVSQAGEGRRSTPWPTPRLSNSAIASQVPSVQTTRT
jgi:hypothetical protein